MTADPSAALAAIRARAAYLRGMQKDAIDHAYTVSPTDASVCGQVGHEDVPRMADALAAVLALHQPTPDDDGTGGAYWCTACGEDVCDGNYPCPTVAAITAHLTDEEWYCTACGSSGSHTYLGCTAHLPATPTTED